MQHPNMLQIKTILYYRQKSCIIYILSILDSTSPFVYNYKPANFEEDFISALTALVTAQDDPQRLEELTIGAKRILNDYKNELPNVLRQVKWNFS